MLSKRSSPSSKPQPAAASRRRKRAAQVQGLTADEVVGGTQPADVEALCQGIRESGGGVVGAYRDPVGGHWQRRGGPADRSGRAHAIPAGHLGYPRDEARRRDRPHGTVPRSHRRGARPRGDLLDPERPPPAGSHEAARRAEHPRGGRPGAPVAYQILAMNTEKGHNLREKSLEVVRMARSLAGLEPRTEQEYALEFEEAAYLTLGLAYEKRGRLSGGAYHPVLKRVETFLAVPLPGGHGDPVGAGGRAARARRPGDRGCRRPQEAGVHQPVPQGVRGGAPQPAALPARRDPVGGCCARRNDGGCPALRPGQGEGGRPRERSPGRRKNSAGQPS